MSGAGAKGARAWAAALLAAALPTGARAAAEADRADAAGYFRVMTRPDFQGGPGRLGYWNLYGRLLNEGPYAALELKLDLLQAPPGAREVWTSVHARVEGGSVRGADPGDGSLANYRLSQLYVRAGNLLPDVTFRLGTQESYFGELGLYDLRPASVFHDVLGLTARIELGAVELVVGGGDAGYALRGERYATVFSGGGTVRWQLGEHLALGGGGQLYVEPAVEGNPYAPHATPGVGYEDWARGEVVERWLEANPGRDFALDVRPAAVDARSWKAVGYLGFGGFGPLVWNNLFASYGVRHPEATASETFGGRAYTLYVTELTDERTFLLVGDEAQLRLWPGRLDAVVALLYGVDQDGDNDVSVAAPGRGRAENDRRYASAVLRLQAYLTQTLHALVETSVAEEVSLNGNAFREHWDSVFESAGGSADARGLEFGDTDTRRTWQLKLGPVLNPTGAGIFTRPSLRLLWGLQRSNVHAAYESRFEERLDQNDLFTAGEDRHWHSVVALEAEAWF